MISAKILGEKYGAEMALLILLGRLQYNTIAPVEVQSFINSQSPNWELFQKIITVHQVRPLVYNVLTANAIQTDAAFYNKLKLATTRIATGNLLKLKELVRIQQLLKKSGVECLSNKGVLLSQKLYNDYISRETSDIDFIIKPGDFSTVLNLMIADGYESTCYYNAEYKDLFLKSDSELKLVKRISGEEYKIEMHWAITHKMMDIPLCADEVFHNHSIENVLNNEVEILSLSNTFLTLLIHHGVNDVWRTVRHSIDIASFISKYYADIDWEEMECLTRKYKIYKTTCLGLSMCREIYGIEIPEHFVTDGPLLKRVVHNMLRFPPIKRKKLSGENIFQQFRLRDSALDKIRLSGAYVGTALLPNIRDVEAWPIPVKWGFAYYFIKPFRLLLRRR